MAALIGSVDFLRLYLLAGIVAHKVYWEMTKRRVPAAPKRSVSPIVRLVKAVKGRDSSRASSLQILIP